MAQRLGDYRHRCVIQKRTDTRDAAGQPIPAWSEFAVRWMSRRFLSGSEGFQGDAVRQSEQTAEFRTHLTRGVSARMRILYPGPVTTVATGITATSSTLTVASASEFPLVNNHRVRIGSEILRVTAGNGTTSWTVTRGVDSTSAAAATAGTAVQGLDIYDIESAHSDWKFGAETVVLGRLSDGNS